MANASPTQPHAYKGTGTEGPCLYGLSRERSGVSCGKPHDDPIHHPDLAGYRPDWTPYDAAIREDGTTTWYAS